MEWSLLGARCTPRMRSRPLLQRQQKSSVVRIRSPINSPSNSSAAVSRSIAGRNFMAGKNTAAFGIYSSNAAAERAVDQLIAAGFSNQDVSVLMADRQGSKDFAAE